MRFTLANAGGAVQLFRGEVPIGDAVLYGVAKDDMAWTLAEGVWRFSKPATPGASNTSESSAEELSVQDGSLQQGAAQQGGLSEGSLGAAVDTRKPCAADQFRNPETGRCKRRQETGSSALTPCKPGQVRNPETNRCRMIGDSPATLTPCKAGQERNPETNRCRAVSAAAKEHTPCKPGQERNPETNRCRNVQKMTEVDGAVLGSQGDDAMSLSGPSWYYYAAIAAIVVAVGAYAVWEWRVEIGNGWQAMRRRFAKHQK